MTVSVKRNKVQYTGDNSTTAFSVTFPYTETSQVKVYLGSTLQTITTHYTLTDPGATGTVTFGTAPGSGVIVSLIRETDYLQAVDYVNNDALDAETLEKAFDKLTMMAQQLDAKIDGSVGFDETVAGTTSLKLASDATDLAGKLLAFDDSGNFVTTQEIGTFKGSDSTSTTADYVVRDLIRDSSNDNVYFTKVDAPSGTLLTNTSYFELLVDVATVRTLKVAAETARTGAETAETNAAASLASFQGQYKTGSSDPYSGSADAGDLWYDTSASILKYYTGSAFEPVTTSLATVTDNYLTISNQVITAGTVPVSLGGTGATTASGARTALGLGFFATRSIALGLTSIGGFPPTAEFIRYVTFNDDQVSFNKIDLNDQYNFENSLAVSLGGTGATTSSAARTNLGLGTAATTSATDYATAAQGTTADSALQDVVDDTTPQLGGDLDVNGNSIVSASNGNIAITLNGTGNVSLGNFTFDADQTVGVGQDNYVLTYDHSTTSISLEAASGGGISDGDKGDITVSGSGATWTIDSAAVTYAKIQNVSATDKLLGRSTAGAGSIEEISCTSAGRALLDDADAAAQRTTLGLGTAALSASGDFETAGAVSTHAALTSSVHGISSFGATLVDDADAAAARTTLGLGTAATTAATNYATSAQGTTADSALQDLVSDTTPQLGGNLDVNGNSIVSASAGNISITPDTTGKIILDGLSWPTADGTTDQVLKTDGAGNLSFVNQSALVVGTANYIEHSSTVSDSLAISAGTNRMYIANTTFSGSGTMGGYLVISHGYANFTGASALNVTGTLNVVG